MHGWGRKMIHTKLWSEKSEHLQDLGRDRRNILIFIIRKEHKRMAFNTGVTSRWGRQMTLQYFFKQRTFFWLPSRRWANKKN